jgi:hypothetical protein
MGGIVLVDLASSATQYLDEGELNDAETQSATQSSSHHLEPPALPPALPGLPWNPGETASIAVDLGDWPGTQLSVSPTGDGALKRKPFGGKVTTDIFGLKGTGSAFVYVFDRSASMEDLGGKPLRAAKRQLIESLRFLGDEQQFQVIFYNDSTRTYRSTGGDSGLVFATAEERRRAERFVDSIRGEGGTDHMSALKLALAMGPDVIFLLTDAEGGFTVSDLAAIGDFNRSGTVINAIEFGVGSQSGAGGSLRKVAEESRGQYIYKDVRSLRD